MDQRIIFHDTITDEEIEFTVIEETRVNNTNYLLVTEEADESTEEAEAYILKDLSSDEDSQAIYEMVEDDLELEMVSKIFAELLEDIDLE